MRRYEDPYHPIPDDYRWTHPDALAEYCRRFAAELLLKDVKRSPEDRKKLATHCGALLLRVAETITGSVHDGRSPEIHCRLGGAPSRAFAGVIFESKKSERRIYIARAAQLVFGNKTDAWLTEYRGKKGHRLHQASENDAGFFIVLRQLDDIALQREAREHDIKKGRLPADIGSIEGGEEEDPWEEVQKRRTSPLNTVHNSRKKRRRRWWEDEKQGA